MVTLPTTQPLLTVRCSSLTLAAQCTPSLDAPAVRVESDDEAARVGTAVHAVLAGWIRGDTLSVREAASRQRVDADEVGSLAGLAWKHWSGSLSRHFPAPFVEQELYANFPGIRLEGHADVLSLPEPATLHVLDWKTSRLDEDYTDQLRGYCLLGLLQHPDAETARACLVRVRQQAADWFEWTRAELWAWWEELAPRLVNGETYRPGRHCGYCPRFLECPAGGQLLSRAAYDLITLDAVPDDLPIPLGQWLVEGLGLVRMLEVRCAWFRELVKAQVRQAGGRLACSDGGEIALEPHERSAIDYPTGYRVLCEAVGGHDPLQKLLRLNNGEVEDAVRALAAPKQKGAAVKQLYDRLEQAGAILRHTSERLEVRRSVPQLESSPNGNGNAAAE